MQPLSEVIHKKESTKERNSTVNNNSNYSTVSFIEIRRSLTDVIPDDGYYPFYEKQLRVLGYRRFMELVAKARAGSDTPARLFCWMLKNNENVN